MSLSLNRNKRPPKKPEDTNTRMCRLLRRMPMIPPGKSEDVEVVIETIKANEPVELVSFRNAMLMGKKPVRIQFASPVVTNALKYKHGVWMTTVPCELWQMDDAVQFLHGRVLFGGLGLGVAAGGAVISQDEATSVVWGMPRSVAIAGLCSAVLPLGEIAGYIRRAATRAER